MLKTFSLGLLSWEPKLPSENICFAFKKDNTKMQSLHVIVFFRITESKSQKFPVGKFVVGAFGWRTHTLVKEDSSPGMPTYVLPDFGDLPLSLGVGTLGMPG